jgi:hypothetical protein
MANPYGWPTSANKILGWAEMRATFSATGTSINAVPALTTTIYGAVGSTVEVTTSGYLANNPAAGYVTISLWDGTVGSGTQIGAGQHYIDTGGGSANFYVSVPVVLTSSSKTYNVGITTTAATGRLDASATAPAYLKVERKAS